MLFYVYVRFNRKLKKKKKKKTLAILSVRYVKDVRHLHQAEDAGEIDPFANDMELDKDTRCTTPKHRFGIFGDTTSRSYFTPLNQSVRL